MIQQTSVPSSSLANSTIAQLIPQNPLHPAGIHRDNSIDDDKNGILEHKRSRSSSPSSSSSSSNSAKRKDGVKLRHNLKNENPKRYQSFELLRPTYSNDQGLKPSDRAVSLELNGKPVQRDDPG